MNEKERQDASVAELKKILEIANTVICDKEDCDICLTAKRIQIAIKERLAELTQSGAGKAKKVEK